MWGYEHPSTQTHDSREDGTDEHDKGLLWLTHTGTFYTAIDTHSVLRWIDGGPTIFVDNILRKSI